MAHIENGDEWPILVYEVGGYRYSFGVKYFNPEKYEWLCGVIEHQAQTIFNRATEDAEKRVKGEIKTALGIR